MFRKLVSNLPFSPQMLSQLSFYGKRLSRENATRKLVVVFAIMAMVVQFFGFVAPAERTNASSTNDVVRGGITGPTADPKTNMLRAYDADKTIRDLFDYYGISRAAIERTYVGHNINSSSGVYSVGREPSPTGADVEQISVPGQTFHVRPLSSWGAGVNYPALHGARSNGEEFWIIYDCGNLVTRTVPRKPPPPPQHPRFNLKKEVIAQKPILVGELFKYRITINNTGDIALNDKHFRDILPPGIEPVRQPGENYQYEPALRRLTFTLNNFPPGSTKTREFTVRATQSVQLDKDLENLACLEVVEVPGVAICDNVFVKIRKEGVPELSKKVANHSRPKDSPEYLDANNTTVNRGETIQYTLFVKNPGTIKINNFVIQDNLKDILEYADVVNTNGGKVENGIISWPAVDIKPGETIAKIFTVKIKDPIPTTPTSASDPISFDGCLDNAYGEVKTRICVEKPVPKVLEETASELPNTGVSLNVVMTTLFVVFAAYFFLRNRQLVKEIGIIKKEYTGRGA